MSSIIMVNDHTNKIALGTAQFGMKYGIANKNGQIEQNEVSNILNLATSNGINTIDTAKMYGTSEESIGAYVSSYKDISWEIITKVNKGDGKLKSQISDSIDKLKTTPSTILAHSSFDYLDSVFRKNLHQLKNIKGIKQVGVSVYTIDEIKKVLSVDLPDVIQCPLNILDTKLYKKGILDKIKGYNINIHIRSVFLQGLFYLSENEIKKKFPDVYPVISQLVSMAQNEGLRLAELSLLWVSSLEQVDKIIIGVDSVDQLKAHMKTLNKKVDHAVFKKACALKYENENVLNPALWKAKS